MRSTPPGTNAPAKTGIAATKGCCHGGLVGPSPCGVRAGMMLQMGKLWLERERDAHG